MKKTIIVFIALLLPLLSVKADEQSASHWQKIGDDYYSNQRYMPAVGAYLSSLFFWEKANRPDVAAVIRHQLAFTYLGMGNKLQAVEYLEKNRQFHYSRKEYAQSAPIYLYLCQIYRDLNQPQSIVDVLQYYPAEDESDVIRRIEVFHLKTIALERLNREDEAREFLRRELPKFKEVNVKDAAILYEDANRLDVDMRHGPTLVQVSAAALAIVILLSTAVYSLPVTRRYASVVVVVSFSFLIALLAAEFMLRMSRFADLPTNLLFAANQTTSFTPARGIMPGVDYTQSHFSTNEIGLRAPPVPDDDTIRVVAIGGSTTETLFLDDEDAWTAVLQKNLVNTVKKPIWVGNAGKSGFNAFSNLVELDYYGKLLRPKIVIVQAAINDLNVCISGGKQALYDNNQRARWPDFYDQYKVNVFDHIGDTPSRSHIALMDLVSRAYENRFAEKKQAPARSYVKQDTAADFYNIQRQRRLKATIVDTAPDITSCIDVFKETLDQMILLAKKYNTQLAFLTQGALYRPDLTPQEDALLWFGSIDENPFSPEPPKAYYSATVMGKLLSQYNQAIFATCKQSGAICVDVDEFLPKTTSAYYDDVHFNVNGAKILGEELAKRLTAHLAN